MASNQRSYGCWKPWPLWARHYRVGLAGGGFAPLGAGFLRPCLMAPQSNGMASNQRHHGCWRLWVP